VFVIKSRLSAGSSVMVTLSPFADYVRAVNHINNEGDQS
jgi:hypothetical protein